jgi:hypothetical protein
MPVLHPSLPALPPRAEGFALPLAVAAALLLILASLGLQTVLVQARLRNGAELEQRRLEDGLAAAAQQVVARVATRHSCLLTLPLQQWPRSGVDCADLDEQLALLEGEILSTAYRLQAWAPSQPEPDSSSRQVDLEIVRRPGAGQSAWRAAFALDLHGDPPQVRRLRELGLRGVQP